MTGITPLGAIVTGWFTEKRGLVFGVLAAGFGTSLIAASIAQFLISSLGWQRAYLVIGLFAIVAIVPLVLLFVRRGPARRGPVVGGKASGHEGASAPPPEGAQEPGWGATTWTLRRAMRTPQLWLLFFAGFCEVGLAEKVTIAHQVYFFRDVGYEPMAAATIYSVFGVAFVGGTLLSSISDRLGREAVYVPACALGAGAAGMLFLIQDTSNQWMPFVFAVCFGLSLGVSGPVLFAAVADLFHGRGYGAIQGFVVLGLSMGGALSPWLAGFLHDRTGSYDGAFVLLVASLLVCAILMLIAAPRRLVPVSRKHS
ncbi:MAG: MFS transporter, partial [Chloroflexota bacterium]